MPLLRCVLLLLIAATLTLPAQEPEGRLYLSYRNSPTGRLGVIEYPAGVLSTFDSVNVRDIKIHNGSLYAVEGLLRDEVGDAVFVYDLESLHRTDTIAIVQPLYLGLWKDVVLVSSGVKPYLRGFDAAGGHAPVFEVPDTVLGARPIHFLVDGDRAYVLTDTSVVDIDLRTLRRVAESLYVPDANQFPGFGQFIMSVGDEIIIDYPLITNAIRSNLMSYDKRFHEVRLEYRLEGFYNYRPPVVAGERLYLAGGLNHYHARFHTFISQGEQEEQPIAYDPISDALFTLSADYSWLRTYSGQELVPSDSVALPRVGVLAARFVPDTRVSVETIQAQQFSLRISPNPAADLLTIDLGATPDIPLTASIFDATGRNMRDVPFARDQASKTLDLAGLPSGWYNVSVASGTRILGSAAFVRR